MSSPPTELLYAIISHAWELPLMPWERIQFMTSSKLVSRTWAAVFDDISGADVHVPCESFYHHYFESTEDYPYSRCQRITFTVHDPDRQRALAHPYTRTLSYMRHDHMARLLAPLLAPPGRGLRCIRLVFHDTAFPDPYAQGFFSALPAHVPTLVVSYTFSPDMAPSVVEHYRRRFERKSQVRYAAPRVGTLVVNGADEFIAAVWESLFPSRQRLVRDGKESERLMTVSSIFSTHKALWVRLEDAQRQLLREEEAANAHHHHHHPALDLSRMIRVVDGDDGRMFITVANPLHDPPHFLAQNIRVGDVGYFNRFSEFVPLFNALEPHIVPSSSSSSSIMTVIPSLFGYGDARVRFRNRFSNSSSRLARRFFARRVLGLKMEAYLDAKEDGAAFKWFKATAESVVEAYGMTYDFRVEDLVLVLSSSK